MRRIRPFEMVFAATGFAGLLLQVVWQRIISLHVGVDLVASTSVVAAFMAGLGVGSLLGSSIASRWSTRANLMVYAVSVVGIGAYGLMSPVLLTEGARALAPHLTSAGAIFLFNCAVLCVPTTLMGLSLPLLATGVVSSLREAPEAQRTEQRTESARLVGRLYAFNTLGAAVGAGVSGWYLLGTLGFVRCIWLASAVYGVAGLWAWALWWRDQRLQPVSPAREIRRGRDPAIRWYVLYGATGALALGFEVVYLRLVDALMRSNAYTFAHVLMLYLVCFAVGTAVGARFVRRSTHWGRTFLLTQLLIGASALAGVMLLLRMPLANVAAMFHNYFLTDGYLVLGPQLPDTARSAAKLAFVFAFGPLTVMGMPVFLMGFGYPFLQAEVSQQLATVGRGTGRLMFSNIVGNVVGTLLVSFVLLDHLGSAGVLRLLALCCGGLGLLAFTIKPRPHVGWGMVAGFALTAAVFFPSNERLWAFFHSASVEDFTLVEERSCVNAWVKRGNEQILYINATSQNGWPYDDFHVVIGMVPSLVHAAPKRALAVGLGAGSTAWGLLQDQRLRSVECVEICGGEVELIRILASRESAESHQLIDDRRASLIVGDGRKHLQMTKEPYDVITVDAMRPNGASAGNVYSLEFYQSVLSHLTEDGVFAQWIPTPRVLETVKAVFPHVLTFETPGGRGRFLIASRNTVAFDKPTVLERFSASSSRFSAQQRASIKAFLESVAPATERAGEPRSAFAEDAVNRDLFPRDEYFLN
jgi:spermidine synthase